MQRLKDHPILIKRFEQVLWMFLWGLSFGAIISWFSRSGRENVVAIIMLSGALILSGLAYLYRRGKRDVSIPLMHCCMAAIVVSVAWFGGGLHSIMMIAFPILMLFAAAYSDAKHFLVQFVVVLCVTVLFGLNSIYGWHPAAPEFFVTGWPRLIGFMNAFTVCCLLLWLISKDVRYAFTSLENEKLQIIKSNQLKQSMVDHDSLTGLLSYQGVTQVYEGMLKGLDVGKEQIVFYFIDLDNFKRINDLYDHSAGDELLMMFSQRLMILDDEKTAICRIGGDEFVLFKVTDMDEDTDRFSEQLVELISSEPYHLSAALIGVSASVGVYSVTNQQMDFDAVRKKSDMAMIQAKQLGKNNYHRYSEALESSYMANLTMIHGLKQALALDLLDVHFQPKVDLRTNQFIGVGTELVWSRRNPQKHHSNEFLPVIETTELIHEIGAWMIEQSCIACKQWQNQDHDLWVSVSVSAVQLARESFADQVAEILAKTGLSADQLVLIIPEHSLYEDEAAGLEAQINKLTESGIRLAIGSFGNGYSNLSRLTKLKIEGMSLDDNFVSKVCSSENTQVVIAAIVDVAKQLKMNVAAKDISSHEQVKLLTEMGCKLGSGSYWSRPLPVIQFIEFISQRKS